MNNMTIVDYGTKNHCKCKFNLCWNKITSTENFVGENYRGLNKQRKNIYIFSLLRYFNVYYNLYSIEVICDVYCLSIC